MPEERDRRPQAQATPQADQRTADANNEMVRVQQELEENPRDEIVEGGRFILNGQVVNAKGEPLDKEGKVLQAKKDEE